MPAFMHVCAEPLPDIMGARADLVIFFICLAVFTTQLFCCWKVENILVWFVPLVVNIICIVVFFLLWVNAADEVAFYERLDMLIASLFSLLAIGLGWGIFWLWNFLQSKNGGNPAGY